MNHGSDLAQGCFFQTTIEGVVDLTCLEFNMLCQDMGNGFFFTPEAFEMDQQAGLYSKKQFSWKHHFQSSMVTIETRYFREPSQI